MEVYGLQKKVKIALAVFFAEKKTFSRKVRKTGL